MVHLLIVLNGIEIGLFLKASQTGSRLLIVLNGIEIRVVEVVRRGHGHF